MSAAGSVHLLKTAFRSMQASDQFLLLFTSMAMTVRGLCAETRVSHPHMHSRAYCAVRAPNAFLFEKYLETRVYEVVAAHSTGRPTLVFCASRNGTRTTAECLVKDALIHGPRLSAQAYGQAHVGRFASRDCACSPVFAPSHASLQFHSHRSGASTAVSAFLSGQAAQGARARCIQAASLVKDKRLADCLRHGVGYHSAGETGVDRVAMERLFGEGSLPVLCTTTTLAMGVNLPAHLVVIKSTQAWRGAGQGYTEYPVSQLLQMMVGASTRLFRCSRRCCAPFL